MRKGYVVGILLVLVGCAVVGYDCAERHAARRDALGIEVAEFGELAKPGESERRRLLWRSEDETLTGWGAAVGVLGLVCVCWTALTAGSPPGNQ